MFLGSFNRRKRNSLYVTVTLLIVSVLILTVGLAATTRTQNVTVGGYYPGVIVSIELLGRSRKRIVCKVPCNAENVIKGDLVLNIFAQLLHYHLIYLFYYYFAPAARSHAEIPSKWQLPLSLGDRKSVV